MKLNLRYNSPLWLGLGLTLTALMLCFIAWGRVKNVQVPRIGVWEETPRICPGPGIDIVELGKALDWWKQHDHDMVVDCDLPTVTIDVDVSVDTRASVEDLAVTHGLTNVSVEPGGRIREATIRVLPNLDSLFLAHEVGHAFGYIHPRFCPSGHILHPHNPGWDGRGL